MEGRCLTASPVCEEAAMRTQAEKAALFQELHQRPGTFIIPNPWDAGTARLLASLGFEALATTSLGLANIHGRGFVSADEIIDNARMIAAATDLPTNGDLENCGAERTGGGGEADPPRLRGRTRRRLDR